MPQNINLIPQSEKQEQSTEKAVKLSTVLSIFMLLLVAGVAVYYFYTTRQLKDQIAGYDDSIQSYRSKITQMAPIEINARNLSSKYTSLQTVFAQRSYYSQLLKELQNRTGTTVTIENLSFGLKDTVNISGTAPDYIAIAKFIKDVSDPKFSSSSQKLQGLFTGVTLNSVSLENRTNQARFFVVVDFNRKALHK